MIKYRRPWNNEHNINYVVKCLIHVLGLRIRPSTAESYLIAHHAFPSLLTIKDFFNYYGVRTSVVKINPGEFGTYGGPVVVLTKKGYFSVIENQHAGRVRIVDFVKGTIIEDGERLIANIEDTILYFTSIPEPLIASWFERLPLKRLTLAIVTLALVIVGFKSTFFDSLQMTLLCLNAIGFTSCLILFIIHSKSSKDSKFCNYRELGEIKIDCRSLINSAHSKLGRIDLIDLGVCLFLSLSMNLVTTKVISDSFTNNLLYMGIVFSTIPVIAILVGYQIVMKTFCTYCIGVQLVLAAEVALVLSNVENFSSRVERINQVYLLVFGCEVLLVAISWISVKELLTKAFRLDDVLEKFIWLKRKKDIVNAMFQDEAPWVGSNCDIIIGNHEANDSISIVSKLGCPKCADTIETYFVLWSNNSLRVNLRLRIIDLNPNDVDLLDSFVSMLRAPELRDLVRRKIMEKYSNLSLPEISMHNSSLDHLNFKTVPQLYFNNKHVPKLYDIEDLRYFITLESPHYE